MRASFRAKVVAAVKELGRPTLEDLRQRLDLAGPGERKKLGTALSELVREGRLERHEDRSYTNIAAEPGVPAMQEVMWRILRAKRLVTADHLAALALASPRYVRDWLEGLRRMGLVESISGAKRLGEKGHYRLLKDPGVEMPRNEAKAEKLRRLRQKKKMALAKIDTAWAAIAEARMAVIELEEE